MLQCIARQTDTRPRSGPQIESDVDTDSSGVTPTQKNVIAAPTRDHKTKTLQGAHGLCARDNGQTAAFS